MGNVSLTLYGKFTASECYGNDASQFPSSNLFAAAGGGYGITVLLVGGSTW